MSLVNETAITTLGRKIRTARVIAGMKQEELARYVGVSRSAVGQWEKDETEPSALKLITIARATQQPLGWFAEGLSVELCALRGSNPGPTDSESLDLEYQLLCLLETVQL